MVRSRYRLSLFFRISLDYGKFKFSTGIERFGLKTISHGKPDLKKSFLKSGESDHDTIQGQDGVHAHIQQHHVPVLYVFIANKLNTLGEVGDVGIRGGPVP